MEVDMKRRSIVLAVALVFGLAGHGRALVRPALPGPEPASSLDSLTWLAGAWEGHDGEMEMEELWVAPKGGAMLGLHRDVKGGRVVSFEFLRIEAGADGIVYHASPGGRPSTPFRLVESGKARAVFANPDHDFPQRILYWRAEDGSLHARIEGPQGGRTVSEEWTWRRAK
jgi:uncharacterized protein DUF6265